MADCAAVGCSEPALEVWRPTPDRGARFHYLVCQFHGLALRSDAEYTVEGPELHIEELAQLLDFSVSQSGGNPVVRLVYGNELESVEVALKADHGRLKLLGEAIAHIDDPAS